MSKRANRRRCSVRELEEKSVQICLECPMADCVGSRSCAYLRGRLAEMGLIAAEKKPARERTCPVKYYVEYEGKEYTLRQMAEMSGCGIETTKSRYHYGWTGKEMMQGHRDKKAKPERVKGKPRNDGEKYEYDGRYYTVREMAEICGVCVFAVYRRIGRGWTVKEILQNHRDGYAVREDIHKACGSGGRVFEYEGREYTYEELAEICGRTTAEIKRRVYNGWTVKEILQNHRDEKEVHGYGQDPHPKSEREQGLDGA